MTEHTHPEALPALDVHISHPVRIVQDDPPRSWSVNQVAVGANADRVASELEQRAKLTLSNTGANPVYIAPTASGATATTGYQLAAGAVLTIETVREVWACSPAGSSLALLAQHRDG